ncbi:MAG: GH36-type glycosyl hydrolase domain-containing protein, partial [Kiritimatiellia bacterium]
MPTRERTLLKHCDGFFTPDGQEYVITNPNLGKPWVNFLTNSIYGVYLTHTGGGFSMANQELRVNYYEPRFDRPGKWVYVRDDDDGSFWSLTWGPVKRPLRLYRCRVGFGYTVFETACRGIRGTLRIFVPCEDPVEIWTITITNGSNRTRHISLFPFQCWKLTGYVRPDNVHEWFSRADYSPTQQAIIGEYFDPHNLDRKFEGFFYCEARHRGYECSGQRFMGTFYNGWENPVAVRHGRLSNSPGYCEQTIACFHVPLTLPPGRSKTFSIIAGYGESSAVRGRLIARYGITANAEREFEQMTALIHSSISAVEVRTPSQPFDIFTNFWLKNQVYVMGKWKSRGGSFRNGFRDTLQDARAILPLDPAHSRSLILEALRYQYPDGHCLRQWSLSGDHDYRYYVDSPYWIVYALTAYLKETGDFAILDEEVPYFSGPGLSVTKTRTGFRAKETFFEPSPPATVWEHTCLALRHLFSLRGQRGLILFGWGDINDAFDLCGRQWKGESVWMTEAFYAGLSAMIELCEHLGRSREKVEFTRMACEIKRSFSRVAWDGQWFRRGWTDWDEVVGSSQNREGSIHLLPQTWAVLSNIAPEEQQRQALRAVQQRLYCKFGPKLFAPPYETRDPHIGQMTALRGHMNNNPYTHHSIQLIQAYTRLGMGNQALDLFLRVLPPIPRPPRNAGFKTTYGEPYTISNYYVADDDPTGRGGEAGQGWLTASGGWLFISATEHILGIRPEYNGLRIDPCLPDRWRSAFVGRHFRGATYEIEILNPRRVEKGLKKITVDGKPVCDNLLPI